MSLILSGSEGLSDVDGTAATPAIRGTDTNTGIFFPAADTIAFAEGGVESMRLDSSGNVGIGTTSPATRLQVNGQTRVSDGTTNIDIVCASSTGFIGTQTNAPLVLRTNDIERARIDSSGNLTLRTGGSSTTTHIFGFNEGGGEFNLCDNTGTGGTLIDLAFGSTRLLHVLSTGNQVLGIGSGNTTGVIQFMRAGFVEAARIDSSGNLLVGTTSQLASTSFASFSTGNGWVLGLRNTANSSGLNITNGSGTAGYSAIGFYNNGLSYSSCGTVTVSGTTTTYGTSSDYRMKENVQPMVGALARVAALKPVTYTWKSTGEEGEGFIAHELQEVCPSAVVGEKDAVDEDGKIKPQNIDTSFLVATLTAAIQELKAELDAVKTELAALKGTA